MCDVMEGTKGSTVSLSLSINIIDLLSIIYPPTYLPIGQTVYWGFSITSYKKPQVNFLANPISIYLPMHLSLYIYIPLIWQWDECLGIWKRVSAFKPREMVY